MNNPSGPTLESLMPRCLLGDPVALEEFYNLILNSDIFVPERLQDFPIKNEASYPTELFNLLGIREGEESYIPVFSNKDFIKEWSEQELTFRTVSFNSILQLCPDHWNILLNASQGTEKLFTFWEIEKLRLGKESIEEIILELLSDNSFEPTTKTIPDTDLIELKKALSEYSESKDTISSLYLVEEENDSQRQVLLGAEIHDSNKEILFKIESELSQIASHNFIGEGVIRTRAFTNKDSTLRSFFTAAKPFYSKK
mgnify:CR=1 FL=1